MGLETSTISLIAKFIWAPLAGLVSWLSIRAVNTYTKEETEKFINNKIRPVEVVVANLNETLKRQTDALERLSSVIAELDKRLTIEEEKGRWQK